MQWLVSIFLKPAVRRVDLAGLPQSTELSVQHISRKFHRRRATVRAMVRIGHQVPLTQ
jgi:hypothetical protein